MPTRYLNMPSLANLPSSLGWCLGMRAGRTHRRIDVGHTQCIAKEACGKEAREVEKYTGHHHYLPMVQMIATYLGRTGSEMAKRQQQWAIVGAISGKLAKPRGCDSLTRRTRESSRRSFQHGQKARLARPTFP